MWTDDLQSQIFSRIIYDSEMQKLQKKYPDFTLTTSMVSDTDPTFPTLVFQITEKQEIGQDLNNQTINLVNVMVQIDIIDNQKEKKRVKEIMNLVQKIMKSLRFTLREERAIDTNDEKRSILIATRPIGSGEPI